MIGHTVAIEPAPKGEIALARIIHAAHDRGASLPGQPAQPKADPPPAEMGLCRIKSLLVPIVSKVPMVPKILNGLNRWNALNPIQTVCDALLAQQYCGLEKMILA